MTFLLDEMIFGVIIIDDNVKINEDEEVGLQRFTAHIDTDINFQKMI